MSNVEKLIEQCLRDIRRQKARRYNALRVKHKLYGLDARARLVIKGENHV